ncbi:hypothetical protein GCM10009798_31070 [Nocardioides panacihumi]|uniref:Transglycosylase SLT domain-containing protein n=1 Tax=Nocardioides panacihumi TaxID=400774 RepID=A0ABN2RFN8_9ACTN
MTPRLGNLPKAITLVPLAALSVVWTVDVVRTPQPDLATIVGATSSTTAPSQTPTTPTLPDAALVVPPGTQAPASVWGVAPATPGTAVVAAPAVSTTAIPPVALAAYQRAATVMNTADPACHLDWSLIAGIGLVESGHGTHGGSQLSADGRATPAIVGPSLTGLAGTMLVTDTDGGRLDGDTRFDHAVGPMQFLPSTWATVGVDADGDGQRDPQDINDAALAAGVYLCSGPEDLATGAGQQAALLRYNHSPSYVATVMRVAAQYRTGVGFGAAGFATSGFLATRAFSVGTATGDVLVTEPAATGGTKGRGHGAAAVPGAGTQPAQTKDPGNPAGHHGAGDPTDSATGQPELPAQPPATEPPASDPPATDPPATDPPATDPPATDPPSPGDGTPTPAAAATADELTKLCTDKIEKAYPQATTAAHDQAIATCAKALDGKTATEADAAVDDLVTALPQTIDGLGPLATAAATPSEAPSTEAPSSDATPSAAASSTP